MRSVLPTLAAAGLATLPANGAELSLSVELPTLSVAEYHRPYLAAWIEGADQNAVATLAVWYDMRLRNERGKEWLKDLRQWWRRGGRALELPADGVSGATRAPGRHELTFADTHPALARLPAGEYRIAVEVAREAGGREVVRVPFHWPPRAQDARASGSTEIGAVSLAVKP